MSERRQQQEQDICPWIAQIDHYTNNDLDEKKAQNRLGYLLSTDAAKEALYQNTTAIPSTQARAAFLNYLYHEVLKKLSRIEPINEKAIKMEELLGEKGLRLYKEAVAEEKNSQAFRDAVMLKSTKHYEGESWKNRLILLLGGPSAAGKSVGASAAIHAAAKEMESTGASLGNEVVSVDGGIDREVSQMRQMVLQVALAKGYKGIEDLHSHTKLVVKKYVHDAALATPHLSLVIPETFADRVKEYGLDSATAGLAGGVARKQMEDYDKIDEGKAVLAFGMVAPPKSTVVKNGNSRAWNSTEFTQSHIKMNNPKLPCESKKYQQQYYSVGKKLSEEAMKTYLALGEHKDRMVITIKSDFTFIKPQQGATQDPKTVWVLADKKEKWNPSMIGISLREFNEWELYQARYNHYEKLLMENTFTPEKIAEFKKKNLYNQDRMSLGEWIDYRRKHQLSSATEVELIKFPSQTAKRKISNLPDVLVKTPQVLRQFSQAHDNPHKRSSTSSFLKDIKSEGTKEEDLRKKPRL